MAQRVPTTSRRAPAGKEHPLVLPSVPVYNRLRAAGYAGGHTILDNTCLVLKRIFSL